MQLRNYQHKIISDVDNCFARQKTRVLVQSPTGSGKTVTMAAIISRERVPVCAIAHRNELVCQISCALAESCIFHNIIAPDEMIKECVRQHVEKFGRNFYNPDCKVTVAGVGTLNSRRKKLQSWANTIRLWIIDECHHVLKDNQWGKSVSMFKNARGIGFTATPERADGMGLGAHADGVFEEMIEGPRMSWLIESGHLCNYICLAPPSDYRDSLTDEDLGPSGEFIQGKLRIKSKQSPIVGDVVDTWLDRCPGKRTVVFATNIEDSDAIAEKFRSRGVSTVSLSSNNSTKERNDAVRDFRLGKITVLVNCDLFGEGFDLPAIECVVMARPTMSYALYAQQFGRVLRIMDGKKFAIIIDHVGNIERHRGPPDRPRVFTLDRRDARSRQAAKDSDPWTRCSKCWHPYEKYLLACPMCHYVEEMADRGSPKAVDGDLVELTPEVLDMLYGPVDKVDIPVEALLAKMSYTNASQVVINSMAKNHVERQNIQKELRNIMMLWGGKQKNLGLSKREAHKKFLFRFNIDVVSATALGKPDALILISKICEDLAA
jgi:superfamily II DNA or RNA helicase